MHAIRDLSYRIKVPLAVSAVIVVVAAIMATMLGAQIYRDARSDLLANAESLGRTLAKALTSVMLRDDLWRAYETIMAPLTGEDAGDAARKSITVLDSEDNVYVSSDPREIPMRAPAARVFGALGGDLRGMQRGASVVEDRGRRAIQVAVPIVADDGARLGTVILSYPEDILLPRFYSTVRRVLLSTLLALAVLVPLGWRFGRRMAAPLVKLAGAMTRVGEAPAGDLTRDLYRGGDEIGRVGARFEGMLHELEDKQRLEREVVAADRLAAIGRLTAGIAHEINNPLAGMLTAIDTSRKHGTPDPVVAKTLSLVERGLQQIRHTVNALLVEARLEPRALTPEDVEDVRTLVEPEAMAREQRLHWESRLDRSLPLPSTSIRQILMNLVLNAIQAAGVGGRVTCRIVADASQMSVAICNDGRAIPAEQLGHLFEPFSSSTGGSGLGLWVTYQIVDQLHGSIRVRSEPSETEFSVELPLRAAA